VNTAPPKRARVSGRRPNQAHPSSQQERYRERNDELTEKKRTSSRERKETSKPKRKRSTQTRGAQCHAPGRRAPRHLALPIERAPRPSHPSIPPPNTIIPVLHSQSSFPAPGFFHAFFGIESSSQRWVSGSGSRGSTGVAAAQGSAHSRMLNPQITFHVPLAMWESDS
jgi:hypothetical protein